ncbi:MAG: acyl-CoA dehydratase activase-related protein [Desulfobacula sp.]|jgi:predicted CoA-substrate-specific enzyme activase
MIQATVYKAGLDIGSTTAKIALLDFEDTLVFSDYQRHHARIDETAASFFKQILERMGDCYLDLKLTGSAALGASKRLGLPFVQEVIAAHEVIKKHYPDVRCAMDIGGEDSKVIFFEPGRPPDIRMNGSCAGGTGSFIDQMATLLNITPFQLNDLVRSHDHVYPVASRCGVFAKTDVQNMLARNIPHKDIAASIFHAVAIQCINSLARGVAIKPKMLLCGGVFAFLPELVNAFLNVLHFSSSDVVLPGRSELIPAIGAALFDRYRVPGIRVSQLIQKLDDEVLKITEIKDRLDPLFFTPRHFDEWKKESGTVSVKTCPVSEYQSSECYLGIDSGSTTTKITVIGKEREVLFSYYRNNNGNPVKAAIQGLIEFRTMLSLHHSGLKIRRTAVTGYGEDLIRAAFNMDHGIVETMAHTMAARVIDPEVSFILDIGGQDMKAVFIDQGVVNRVELNEACSSGCGSFLEALAGSLNYPVGEFGALACRALAPCDLGTRCTVFMNSKIKQSLRENASIEDISAGLSYAVIKNCLFKVLKLHTMSEMGDHIVLQGGTFKNPSVVRALEQMTGKKVRISNIPELMGAFGAALFAREEDLRDPSALTGFPELSILEAVENYQTNHLSCKGCENICRVTRFVFSNGRSFFSGNKCEKYYSSKGDDFKPGFDFVKFKTDQIFNRELAPHEKPRMTLGIPRCLNFFDNFVFWHTLFTGCGINIALSSPSTVRTSEKGMGTVMSDNICFPAKLAHGHIIDLVEKGVDRIFYPMVVFEKNDFEKALNTYNCPIVSGYADVIESAIPPEMRFDIPLDRPVITFKDKKMLKKACFSYLEQFRIKRAVMDKAFEAALDAQEQLKEMIRDKALEIVEKAGRNKSLLIVLAGRPYHADGLINHKIPEILTGLGADIITEDALSADGDSLRDVQVATQWAYPNRIYNAAAWVAKKAGHVQLVQLNSFGCGPDAVVIDEVREILKTGGKNHTLIKVDEISSPGSVRLRLRSMVESLKLRKPETHGVCRPRKPFLKFVEEDRKRTILAPFFAEDYSAYLPAVFKNAGYDFHILPKPDRKSVDLGLQYASNDICYPGTIVIGDIIKALKTHSYDPQKIAVGITQTGGQCRASNYLSLIRKAMISAGFEDIPIISVTASGGLVDQPGFHINWLSKTRILLASTLFSDCIAKMYYATATREKIRGQGQKIRQYYMQKAGPGIIAGDCEEIYKLLEKAVADFNEIPVHKKEYPKMGIVGEIYAKYNSFANQDLVHWLMDQGIEPVIPPLIDYFIQDLVNYKENIKAGIRKRKITDFIGVIIEWAVNICSAKMNTIFSKFRYGLPFDDIRYVAKNASHILNMIHQFGEGWLIPGEIAAFAEQGISHVISVQPFGCIANHIVSKGVEKRIKAVHPGMNLYFLDFDAGMSEANIRNRLHFMIEHLK